MNIMKKYILYIFSCLALLVAASSCNWLEKEPDTEATMETVYNDKDKMMSAFAYVYSQIPNPCWDYFGSTCWEVYADDVAPSKDWQQFDYWKQSLPRIFGTWEPNSAWNAGYWHLNPQHIRGAYLFIQNAKALPEQNITQEMVDLMKLECRFMACYYWWEMARTYGGIPFTPNYIAPTDAPVEELLVGNTPFDEIVAYLDEELLELSTLLPPVQLQPADYGRATSIMALAVRANMLLFAASPLVNGNPMYADYRNTEGELIFNPVPDPNKWVKAAEACQLLVDQAEANGYALYKEFNDDSSIDPFCSLENLFKTNWSAGNKEILFPYTENDNNNSYEEYTRHSSVKEAGGNNGMGLYQGLVDAFFMKNGLPIDDPNSGYVENGFSSGIETRNTKWQYGTGVPGEITADHIYNMYCNREPRFYTAVSFHGSYAGAIKRQHQFFRGQADNQGSWDSPQAGYLSRKRIIQSDNPKLGQWHRNRPMWVYRLGGAYLDLAEALNEAYNDKASRDKALKYVNLVRERAGVRQYTLDNVPVDDKNFITVADNQEAVRKVVRMERRVELCVEGVRWFDIRRWMIAEELPEITGDCYGMNAAGSNEAEFFKKAVYQTRVWNRKYYWMPIFIDEIEKNPNLVQAPFWE